MLTLLSRAEVDAARLWSTHPPKIRDAHKLGLFRRGGGIERAPRGTLSITRWRGDVETLGAVGAAGAVASVRGMFDYDSVPGAWHVNFADPDLFAFYGGPQFAQDEIQVAEHPILACVREAGLTGTLVVPLTIEAGVPTPVLVRGVERYAAIDTEPEAAEPFGIYGKALRRASDEALDQAVVRVDGAPLTNLIAMAAPQSRGPYTRAQIEDVLVTAVTAFTAARTESTHPDHVRVHTGHWGTGAFGGHRVLMAAAQILAARAAGIHELHYHSLDDAAEAAFDEARALAATFAAGTPVTAVIDALLAKGFYWGTSDGN